MFIPAKPLGIHAPSSEDRIPLWRVTGIDDWVLTTRLTLPSKADTPATPDNSRVVFVLARDRFTAKPIWVGRWMDGILPIGPENRKGLVEIRVPLVVVSHMTRGVYEFSLTVMDLLERDTATALDGTLQVEYEPLAPIHNVGHR